MQSKSAIEGFKGGEVLKNFQLTQDFSSKSDELYGKKIAEYILATLGGTSSYVFIRNNRFRKNRSMVNGTYDMSRFVDRLNFSGKLNYANINWIPFHLMNTIISRKVGQWMNRTEKIVVTATDTASIQKKQEQYRQAEFILNHKEQLAQLEQASGIPQVGKDQFIPEDKDDLDLWAAEFNRLPEEILYEKTINNILEECGFFDIIKEKLLHDSCEVGFLGTKVDMGKQGKIFVEYSKPENSFTSYSEFPDFRDGAYRGRKISMKISTLRRKYGVEFGGKFTEEEIWQMAQCAKEYQVPDKLSWMAQWVTALLRPYDEWNLDCTEFEIRSVDRDEYKKKITKSGTLVIDKLEKDDTKNEAKQYVKDDNVNTYYGVYADSAKVMLEWGVAKPQIKPQDPSEINKADFKFSFYMYQNIDMKNVAIPEKLEEPFEQMIICRLKMQQLVAKMRPVGAAINEDALQNIDYGLADKNKDVDYKKQFDQTGDIFYRGRDAEGNPIPVPIIELKNSGFLEQMQGLIALYNHHYQVLKDELGEDPQLSSQASQPRVTSENVQASMQLADNATDYMYNAYLNCLKETARKIGCMLNDSVSYGAKIYRQILNEEQVKGKVFSMDFKMLPTEQEIAGLQQMMNIAIQSTPDLTIYLDPFKIIRIAKEDVKLAELYFRQSQKRYLKSKQQQSQEQQQQNAQVQIQSSQAKAQSDMEMEQYKTESKQKVDADLSKAAKEQIMLQGMFDLYKGGILQPPPELIEMGHEILTNIGLPLFAENMQNKMALQQGMQQMQEQQEQPQQQQQEAQQQGGEQPNEQQEQPNQQAA